VKSLSEIEQRRMDADRRSIPPSVKYQVRVACANRCVLCGDKDKLVFGHIVSVAKGRALGVPDDYLFSAENLFLLCVCCNSGMSDDVLPLRLAATILVLSVGGKDAKKIISRIHAPPMHSAEEPF